MKVTMQGHPVFYFEIDLDLVMLLKKVAKSHYDGECQRSIAVAGATILPGSSVKWQQNGLLTMWHNRIKDQEPPSDRAEVRATWDDLDLIAKVCEGAIYLDGQASAQKVAAFGRKVHAMLIEGNRAKTHWSREFDV